MDQLVPPPVEAPKAWTLTPADAPLIAAKSRANRLSFALLLLFFRTHGRFPRTQDEIEPATVADVARQLDIGLTSAQTLAGSGRTVERHRADIRTLFGCREASVADGETLTAWLRDHAVAETRDTALLAGALEQRCRDLAIEQADPGGPSVNSLQTALAKLVLVRQLGLPADLFGPTRSHEVER